MASWRELEGTGWMGDVRPSNSIRVLPAEEMKLCASRITEELEGNGNYWDTCQNTGLY